MEQAKGYFLSFKHTILFEPLSDAEAGKIIKALSNYAQFGEDTSFDDRYLNYVYDTMRKNVDSYYKMKDLTFQTKNTKAVETSEPRITVEPSKTKAKKTIILERPVKPEMWLEVKDTPEKLDADLAFDVNEFKRAQ